MAKYTTDTNLIRGAATAYRNYDNAPGMYAGLDKITEAGLGVVDEAVKGYEAEQKKLEEEAKAAKAKQEAIENSWNESADQVLLNAGSLGDTLYSSTSDEIKELKKLYLQGVNEKDDKKRLAAMRGLQSHSTWIQDHKKMNQDYAAAKIDGKLSDWYKSEAGSEEAHTVDQIMGQKYTKTSRGEDGDVIFHIEDSNGNEKLVPSKEYNKMIMPKNFTITANTIKLQAIVNQSEILDIDAVKQSVKNSLPANERDFIASMYDDVSGKNLKTMLETSTTLNQEILNSIDPKAWDADTDGVLDPDEKADFIDAVINPENNFFNLETSKQIMADQIFNGVVNRHTKHWLNINNKEQEILDRQANVNKTRGLNLSYGFRTWNQMQTQYDQINAGADIIKGGDGTVWNKQENGTYKLNGGEDVRTPNQLKDHLELNHLDSFAEPEGGYATSETTEENTEENTEILQHGGDEAKMYNMNTMVGEKSFLELFSGDIDDDVVADYLQAAFPGLQIIAPFNLKEKIRVGTREFNVKNKGDMAKLLEYLNSPEIQKLISPQPNTEFNSEKK